MQLRNSGQAWLKREELRKIPDLPPVMWKLGGG